MSAAVGQNLGTYRFTSVVAETPFASFYRAADTRDDAPVCIRVPRRQGPPNHGNLNHRCLLGTAHVVSDAAATYELVQGWGGETLESLLSRGTEYSSRTALEIIRPLAEVLDYIHQGGYVHGALSPSSILVEGSTIRIIDAIDQAGPTWSQIPDEVLLKTHLWLAPETLAGQEPDTKADQYSLAVLALRLITGRNRHVPQSPIQNVLNVLFEESATPSATQIPESVRPVFRKALARHPESRYTSCIAMVQALEAVFISRPATEPAVFVPAPSPTPQATRLATAAELQVPKRGQRRMLILASAAVLVLIAGLAAFALRDTQGAATQPASPVPAAVAPRSETTAASSSTAPVPVKKKPAPPVQRRPRPAPNSSETAQPEVQLKLVEPKLKQ